MSSISNVPGSGGVNPTPWDSSGGSVNKAPPGEGNVGGADHIQAAAKRDNIYKTDGEIPTLAAPQLGNAPPINNPYFPQTCVMLHIVMALLDASKQQGFAGFLASQQGVSGLQAKMNLNKEVVAQMMKAAEAEKNQILTQAQEQMIDGAFKVAAGFVTMEGATGDQSYMTKMGGLGKTIEGGGGIASGLLKTTEAGYAYEKAMANAMQQMFQTSQGIQDRNFDSNKEVQNSARNSFEALLKALNDYQQMMAQSFNPARG